MSIFQAREWWSAETEAASVNEAPDDEEEDGDDDVVTGGGGDAGDDESDILKSVSVETASFASTMGNQADVIVAGSLGGLLRIYSPYRPEPEEDQVSSAGNLLLEVQFEEPIFQIAVGRLSSSGGSDVKIAVLHPRLLSVYALQQQRSKTRDMDNFKLNLLYQHRLSRSAFCLVLGPFGGTKRDFACVQSLDGTLNIFEQESYAFSRFLPGFLLPGPLAYVQRTDSLVTLSSSYQLESFKYQTLAVAGDQSGGKEKTDDIKTGKRISPDWVLGIGEAVGELNVVQSQQKDVPATIVVTKTRSVTALLDTGIVVFMKKLDFTPLCSMSFKSEWQGDKVISLVASDPQTLMVFENTSLKWAAQIPFKPVMIKRGSFKLTASSKELMKNLLVLVSKRGEIFISYLGTDPEVFSAPATITRDVNYEETDKEFGMLTSQIKEAQSAASFEPTASKVQGDLIVTTTMGQELQNCYFETQVKDDEDGGSGGTGVPMVRVTVQLRTNSPLSKVRVTLSAEHPLAVSRPTHVINSLTEAATLDSFVYLYGAHCIPHSLELLVNAVYITSTGAPHVQTQKVDVPLKVVLKPCAPIKDADYKVTISTNKPAVSLLDLFPEFVLDSTMANAAGFAYLGGPRVTLLSSKTSQRYRLQSDDLPALWPLTREIEARLQRMHGESGLQCSYSASLPMHEYFSEIEAHFHKRERQKQLCDQLAQRTTQFRSIERRLLARFKDKTPTTLTNLDTLLEGTYRQIMMVTEALDECSAELTRTACNLCCITSLLLLLARLSTGMTMEEMLTLMSALPPIMLDGQEQGWEETTDAALTFLLRTSLAKPGKENQGATPITLDVPKDTTRLKKHISSVMDRISKGGRIVDGKNAIEGTKIMDFAAVAGVDSADDSKAEADDEDDNDDLIIQHATPVGSKFGEEGERLRSAARRRGRPGSATGSMMSVIASIAPDSGENTRDFNGDLTNGGVEGAPRGDDDDGDVDVDLGW